MHLEKNSQPRPERRQGLGVPGIDFAQDGEEATLLVVVVEDELRDIHAALSTPQ
ncbi:MAG: hypothetical protein M3Z29_13165 [Pseudomonadota bacterium]|nr:hypothetical protein [Pseudomonadota bacterium]